MKKFLCMMLALIMLFALASCGGKKPPVDPETENGVITENPDDSPLPESGASETEENEDADASSSSDSDKSAVDEEKKEEKPTETKKPASAQKPAAAAPSSPSATPSAPVTPPAAEKPSSPAVPAPNNPPAAEAPGAGGTVGDTLAAVWRANSSKSTEEIANAVISHSSVQFMGGVVPVEEGLLAGFDNAEIKGFTSAHMFAPAIGTIPFIGYVFELPAAADADAFVSTLKSNANPRWNICTEAEQTIVEKSGSKVFFLMCPKSFEE